MRERVQADIYLAGVSARGLSIVLEYVYTARISLTLQNIHSVLSAASHLQVVQVVTMVLCSLSCKMQLDINFLMGKSVMLRLLEGPVYGLITEDRIRKKTST